MPLPLLIRETPLNNCEDHIFTSDGKRHLPGHAAFSVSPPRLSIEFSKTRMRAAVSILISSSAWDGARSACMLAYSFRQSGKFLGLSGF